MRTLRVTKGGWWWSQQQRLCSAPIAPKTETLLRELNVTILSCSGDAVSIRPCGFVEVCLFVYKNLKRSVLSFQNQNKKWKLKFKGTNKCETMNNSWRYWKLEIQNKWESHPAKMRWISEIQVFLLIILCFFGTAIQGEPEPQLGVPFPDGKTWFFVTFLGKLDLKEVPNWVDSFIWFCTFGDVNIFLNFREIDDWSYLFEFSWNGT